MILRLLTAALIVAAGAATAADAPISNAADIVKAADWKQMQTVEIVLTEHSYAPDVLTLKANQPYRVVLRNNGEKPHYWSAPEFFQSVATRKAQTKEAEFKAPYFTALEVNNGGVAEFFFVPVKTGTFPVYCTIEDHRDKGMDGEIVVQ